MLLAQLFNVAPFEFAAIEAPDVYAELQNALARHGAAHLRESEAVVPRKELDVAHATRDALVAGVPRLVTALAPVLVKNIDRVNLHKIRALLAEVGLEHRLSWLLENLHEALSRELSTAPPRPWARSYRRATAVLEAELEAASQPQSGQVALDLLDRSIRSTRTRKQVQASASEISRRWGIVTGLQPDDFARALEAARDAA